MDIEKKTIIITGASSGLGAALSIEYAKPHNKLFLFGRSQKRLDEVAKICLTRNADVTTFSVDVTQEQLMVQYIEKIAKKHRIDVLIACAGVSAGTLNQPESLTQVRDIFETNLIGTVNSVMPVIPYMVKQRSGTIVFISSMAGLIGLSSAPAYSASKAAIKIFGDALRAYLKQFHITVCMVIPGYIDTPMTKRNKFPMPLKISSQAAARIIINGMENKKGIITFPKLIYFMLKILNLLPYGVIDYINSKLPGK